MFVNENHGSTLIIVHGFTLCILENRASALVCMIHALLYDDLDWNARWAFIVHHYWDASRAYIERVKASLG